MLKDLINLITIDTDEKFKLSNKNNKETVGIIGLGYVGLPLVVEFALNKVKVIGFDLNEDKINTLKSERIT